ncbi:hypothetical protein MPTK1_7g10360 [Marchantia polymorpha subsp. ruderalis]|uniref:Uncharacterized protein n=2 Tax=Marchantia polymorpha TaxID=3197 RepID=A0AAF6BY27_MARPO|nr:hypothetical protein MARPO_0003s0055 [Marchantia polymorpha]BBN16911.1 hypothetical protein Mp_7g10360 [Marchantia polymorpha subsp. ruderalis]|eukprot:PTQ49152.1 hypothetical protein MARPO_0003s0055 [Marchantia polymorpha]
MKGKRVDSIEVGNGDLEGWGLANSRGLGLGLESKRRGARGARGARGQGRADSRRSPSFHDGSPSRLWVRGPDQKIWACIALLLLLRPRACRRRSALNEHARRRRRERPKAPHAPFHYYLAQALSKTDRFDNLSIDLASLFAASLRDAMRDMALLHFCCQQQTVPEKGTNLPKAAAVDAIHAPFLSACRGSSSEREHI